MIFKQERNYICASTQVEQKVASTNKKLLRLYPTKEMVVG